MSAQIESSQNRSFSHYFRHLRRAWLTTGILTSANYARIINKSSNGDGLAARDLRGAIPRICDGVSGHKPKAWTGSSIVAKLLNLLNRVRKDDEGAAMAEYVVLLGLIVGVLVLVVTKFADVLHTKFTGVCAALGGAC